MLQEAQAKKHADFRKEMMNESEYLDKLKKELDKERQE